MTSNRPHLFDNSDAAAAACSDYVLGKLRHAVEDRGRAMLAVSGGKTPKLLFQHMREADFPWPQLSLFFVDERAVPPGDKDSNYRLAQENFIDPLGFPKENVHRILGEIAPEDAARRYTDEIHEAFQIAPGKMPVFDVIHHGMGPDGHTASLFPGEPLIEDRTGIAAAVVAAAEPRNRITLLPGVLLVARTSVFLVDGADKNAALQSVLTGDLDPMHYPSQLLARSGKHVDWFAAAITWPEAESAVS